MKKSLFTLGMVVLCSFAMAQNTDISIDMNVDGIPDMDMNMNVNMSETHTSTTTTTTSTTTTSGGFHDEHAGHGHTDVYVMPGYNGAVGCNWPMDNGQFQQVRSSISSKDWDDSRLTVAKQVITSNCLTSAQVKEVVGFMEWEKAKLDIAKFAYGYTFDLGNYYIVNDAFEWEASIDELNKHINGYRW
jgi:hypothetical protein